MVSVLAHVIGDVEVVLVIGETRLRSQTVDVSNTCVVAGYNVDALTSVMTPCVMTTVVAFRIVTGSPICAAPAPKVLVVPIVILHLKRIVFPIWQ